MLVDAESPYGSGACDRYHRDSTTGKVALTDGNGDTINVTVYNWTETAIAVGTWCMIGQNGEGDWLILSTEC